MVGIRKLSEYKNYQNIICKEKKNIICKKKGDWAYKITRVPYHFGIAPI